jgi:hypothetical protein
MKTAMKLPFVGGLALVALIGCSNAGQDIGFASSDLGLVQGFVFLDRNGSLAPDPSDTTFAGVRVGLVVAGTTDTAFAALVDSTGNVTFKNVPFGDYRFVVDSTTVGDSLQVQDISTASVALRADAPQQLVIARLGFPAVTVAVARTLAVGTRVVVKAVVLAGLDTYGDSTSHIADNGSAIRVINGANAGPSTGPGDTVNVVGTVATLLGQPVLDQAQIFLTHFSVAPPPATSVTTLAASAAGGGTLDAALVHLTNAVITDTATVGNDYQVGVDDGSGRVVMVLDGDINFARGQFILGKKVNGNGVLVPVSVSGGTWAFKPRATFDVVVS